MKEQERIAALRRALAEIMDLSCFNNPKINNIAAEAIDRDNEMKREGANQ